MRQFSLRACYLWMFMLIFAGVIFGQNKLPSPDLSESVLNEVGIHLPSYMTLKDQAEYQKNLSSHVRVKILWDIYPGQPDRIKFRDLPRMRPTGTLVVKSTLINQPGFMSPSSWKMPHLIFEVGLTDSNEIRSISYENDIRYENGETDSYMTKVELNAWISHDSAITKIDIFETNLHDGTWHLVRVGRVVVQGGAQ